MMEALSIILAVATELVIWLLEIVTTILGLIFDIL